jgi:MFS family permease
MAAVAHVHAAAGRYRSLLTHGTFYSTGLQLTSVSAVLPFICAQQGIFWAAGLLYPAYNVGTIMGHAMSPAVVQRTRQFKHILIAITATAMTIWILANAVAATIAAVTAVVFLVTSWATGLTNSVWKVASAEVASSTLSDLRRGDLMLTQGAAGALLAIVATLVIVPAIGGRDALSGHIEVLWLGAVVMAIAAVAAVFVGHVHPPAKSNVRRVRETYTEGLIIVRSHKWFQHYAVTSAVFVPISLSMTFFSLHASVNHGNERASLHVLVIFACAGFIVGAFVWRVAYRRFGIRGMLLSSALISAAAAMICIAAELNHDWMLLWVHGVVFLLATMANQAIFIAAVAWINACARDHHRATLIGFGSAMVAIESVILGAILGLIAQQAAAIWPVVVVFVLDLVAAAVALRAPSLSGPSEPDCDAPGLVT